MTIVLDTWISTPYRAKILKLLVQTSWAHGKLHKQCVMSSKLAPQASQLFMPPVGTTRWVINQKNTLTRSGRDEFHILLLALSTKTESTTTWAHLLAHFSYCKHNFLSKRVEHSKVPMDVSALPTTYILQDPILNTWAAWLQPHIRSSPPQSHGLVDSPSISCCLVPQF